MNQKKEKVSNKTLDQVLREEISDIKMGEEAIGELNNLGQAWGKTQAAPGKKRETEEGFTARRIR